MASLFKSTEVTANAFPRYNEKGVYALYGSYAVAAALVVNDVIQMVRVPAGARVLRVSLLSTDLDTGTPAIILDVGDGDDTDRFIDGSTVGQAGGQEDSFGSKGNIAGFGYKYTAEDTIDIIVQVAPATGVAGTLTLMVLVCNDA